MIIIISITKLFCTWHGWIFKELHREVWNYEYLCHCCYYRTLGVDPGKISGGQENPTFSFLFWRRCFLEVFFVVTANRKSVNWCSLITSKLVLSSWWLLCGLFRGLLLLSWQYYIIYKFVEEWVLQYKDRFNIVGSMNVV